MALVSLWSIQLARGGVTVLDRSALTMEAGEVVVVGGLRGAGKTSLLAIAAGVLRPDAGEVSIGGRNLMTLQAGSLPYVRRNIGYLPPDPPFVGDETVLENVMLALAARGAAADAAEVAARSALVALGIEALADRSPGSLTFTERRLAATARALAGQPALAVLDDPSLGLDDRDRPRLARALGEARERGTAVLVGTGDPALALALGDAGARLLTLAGGRLGGSTAPLRLVEPGAGEPGRRDPDEERPDETARPARVRTPARGTLVALPGSGGGSGSRSREAS